METNKEAKYKNIVLIPTDFSPVCDNAIQHGVELAKSLKYKVFILHVINRETKSKLKKEDLDLTYIEDKLAAIQKRYQSEYQIDIETQAIEGSIFTVINEVAASIKANLMVLGTHGKKGLQHLFGSFALKVVLESPVPVVVVQKKSFQNGYRKVVFPISNDVEPRQKVQWAMMISKLFNARIHLFRSLEKESSLNGRLEIITQQITTEFDTNKIPYEICVAENPGDFAEQVLSYAVINHADLIMIMTRPNSDLPGFSLSGWDEKLMFNEAQIPIMCINPVELGTYYWEWITPF